MYVSESQVCSEDGHPRMKSREITIIWKVNSCFLTIVLYAVEKCLLKCDLKLNLNLLAFVTYIEGMLFIASYNLFYDFHYNVMFLFRHLYYYLLLNIVARIACCKTMNVTPVLFNVERWSNY